MFRPILALVLLASALSGAPASAQLSAWNRGISNVRMVHPPGTPPGFYTVEVEHFVGLEPSAPAGLDLSRDITVYVDDVPLFVLGDPMDSAATSIQCFGCSPGLCSTINFHGNPVGLYCGFIYPSGPCGCGIRLITPFPGGPYTNTSTVRVTLTPSPGSVPELDTSDDTFTIVVGENDPSTGFCSGDGTLATACPCGNTGASGHGCANSQNAAGAQITATGFTELDPLTLTENVVLHGSGMPATSSAIYLKSEAANPAGSVFGDGVSCLAGALIRLRTKINVGGASQFPEPGDPMLSVRGATPSGSGLTAHYAVYYRNAAGGFCPPATFNISNGLSMTW